MRMRVRGFSFPSSAITMDLGFRKVAFTIELFALICPLTKTFQVGHGSEK